MLQIAGEIDRFNDIFHHFGDDEDETEDKYVDFDNLYKNIAQEDEIQLNKDKNIIDLPSEEQHLSQKLSQLSTVIQEHDNDDTSKQSTTKKRPTLTPTTPTAAATIKKMKADTEEISDEVMPKYLSSSDQTFENMIKPILQKTANTIHIEYFRQIALLTHHLAFIDLNITLWTTYLRSGTGKLKLGEQLQQITTMATSVYQNLSIWHKEVKSSMIDEGYVTVTDANEINHDTYLNYVHSKLHKFRDQTVFYQNQLDERKQRLNNSFTDEIGQAINQYVEDYGIALFRISTETKIAIVEYDFNDRLIELEYHQQNPNEYQVRLHSNFSFLFFFLPYCSYMSSMILLKLNMQKNNTNLMQQY